MPAFDWCENQRPWMTPKGYYALSFKTRASFVAHHENLNEDKTHIISDEDVAQRFWQYKIYADIRWRGCVKRQWRIRKH